MTFKLLRLPKTRPTAAAVLIGLTGIQINWGSGSRTRHGLPGAFGAGRIDDAPPQALSIFFNRARSKTGFLERARCMAFCNRIMHGKRIKNPVST